MLITGEKQFEDHHILSKVTFDTSHSVEYIKHTSDFSLAKEHTQNCLLTAEIYTLSTKTIPKITQDIHSSRASPTDCLKQKPGFLCQGQPFLSKPPLNAYSQILRLHIKTLLSS